ESEPAPERISADVDYLTAAINSLAGKALEAAIRYAVWIKRQAADGSWSLQRDVPAVKNLLDDWANPASNKPLDSRAIFGSQLGPLVRLDKAWVMAASDNLFPKGDDLRPK